MELFQHGKRIICCNLQITKTKRYNEKQYEKKKYRKKLNGEYSLFPTV